ncbi:hypothetical protein [uncultured Aquimarina sp.]|uniref:hypothetical protein n=1 Tax=uncultured Aquimarina sp. TaxID=575652 RepID=UPI002635FE0E|nr:hypothetical protein [uncultured Aquimarina sp.]
MFKKLIIGILAIGLIAVSCNDDDDNVVVANAGEISGGPFEFDVDGEADMVSGITLDDANASGSSSTWIVTDDQGNILGLPPTLTALEGVDFDGAGAGTCLIWYARYNGTITGLEMGMNANDVTGDFDLSNSITVVRNQVANSGVIVGGPFEFDVDGEADMVSGITLDDTNAFGSGSTWIVTDDQGNILGLPPTLTALEGVDFDGAGAGVCLIWYARYEGAISGLEMGMNANDVSGDFDLSNAITVVRNQVVNAGTIAGGPFEFDVDGEADMVSGITLDDTNAFGDNSTWIITDDQGNILGLPPTLAMVEGVDFDGAGAGTCLIWYARYNGSVTGLEMGMNANNVTGDFDLSNPITVVRNQVVNAGTISGGPFEFDVDGTPDMVSGITLDDANAFGDNSTWIITDDQGNILGLPPTLAMVEGVDFDGAGAGTCLIWYARYNGSVTGLEMGMNANNVTGDFDLSNPITVVRNQVVNAGTISGGPFEFDVDGTPDMVSGITLDGTNAFGDNSTWIITDDQGNILGLPPTLAMVEGVDFDAAGPGVCLIWYARYNGMVTGLEMGMNANDVTGMFDLSNSITVTRNCNTSPGVLSGGPFTFTVDGTPDMVSGIMLDSSNAAGPNSTWIITDDQGKILGLPPTLAMVEGVDFNAAGAGVCFIWYLRYEDGVEGLAMDMNANDLKGCFSLSNAIQVTRQ